MMCVVKYTPAPAGQWAISSRRQPAGSRPFPAASMLAATTGCSMRPPYPCAPAGSCLRMAALKAVAWVSPIMDGGTSRQVMEN